jgi:hypothetical protein
MGVWASLLKHDDKSPGISDESRKLWIANPSFARTSIPPAPHRSLPARPARWLRRPLFGRSRSVGAHLGLTPRQYQSGEVDRSGRISKCGDTLARTLLYEAAVVILTRLKKASSLKDWGHAIARRSGNGKARVAVARKLSVILHSVWRSGQPFRWPEHANAA